MPRSTDKAMQSETPTANRPQPALKQSPYGVASLVLGLLIVAGLLSLFGAFRLLRAGAAATPVLLIGLCLLLGGSPVGVVLGLLGVLQRGRTKKAAIIGLVINSILVLLLIWLDLPLA